MKRDTMVAALNVVTTPDCSKIAFSAMPKRSRPAPTAFVSLLLSLLLVSPSAHAQAPACAVDTIPRAELAAQMRTAALSYGEYDLLATPNWTRFQFRAIPAAGSACDGAESARRRAVHFPRLPLLGVPFFGRGGGSEQGPWPSVVGRSTWIKARTSSIGRMASSDR